MRPASTFTHTQFTHSPIPPPTPPPPRSKLPLGDLSRLTRLCIGLEDAGTAGAAAVQGWAAQLEQLPSLRRLEAWGRAGCAGVTALRRSLPRLQVAAYAVDAGEPQCCG
jgi:hypothetical protein